MKKIVIAAAVMIIPALLCGCNEYEEAKNDLTSAINSTIGETEDAKGLYDEQKSEVSNVQSELNSALNSTIGETGDINQFYNEQKSDLDNIYNDFTN